CLLSAIFLAMASTLSAAEFPSTVVYKIGASAAGSQGRIGRIVAAHLATHLPGKPTVGIEAVEGASGAHLVRQFVATEPRDGSVVGQVPLGPFQHYITEPGSYDFQPVGLQWVGSLAKPLG